MADDFVFVPDTLREDLSYRQAQSLERHYQEYRSWLRDAGKNPARNIGFAPDSVQAKFHRATQFHRWVWQQTNCCTTRFTHADAHEYEERLDNDTLLTEDGEPYAESSKRKLQEAVVTYFKFRSCQLGGNDWSPALTFSQSEHNQADYFTLNERDRLYDTALVYDDLGKYGDLSPEARDRGKQYLAQKLEKPKSAVTPADFERCRRSWKIPSLMSVSLDLGARPAFVNRCQQEWFKPEKGVIQIPKSDAAKNDAYWESSLSSRSIHGLNQWMPQRASLPAYDDVCLLWLNREENPYRSGSLNYLLNRLIEEAGIDQSKRKLTWISIRRSTGTYLAHYRSLAYAKEQLRHKSMSSTLRYVEVPVEARQKALDQIDKSHILPQSVDRDSHNTAEPDPAPRIAYYE